MPRTKMATGGSSAPTSRVAVREALTAALRRLGAQPRIGIVFCSPSLALDDALAMAKEQKPDAAWLGCTTAGQFTEEGLITHGLVVAVLASSEMDQELRYSTSSSTSKELISDLCRGVRERARVARESGHGMPTTIALVDGLSGDGERLVDRVYTNLPGTVEIVGGAAGDDGKFVSSVVGADGRASSGAVALLHVFSSHRWGVGVDHGFRPATRMMRVTRAQGNVIHEIDGRPAFEAYRDYAREKGVDLKPADAGPFFINNELGIVLFNELKKARAPLASTDGALTCAAEVPQGAGICILDGNKDDLLKAAGRASSEAAARLGTPKAAGVLLFDCICRGTILGKDFDREIDAVRATFPGAPIAGFLTYGEIARYSGNLDGWHNATAVVAAIPSS